MVPFVIFFDGCIDFFADSDDVFFGVFFRRDMEVADNIRMARTGSEAEIIRMILGIFRLDQRVDIVAHGRNDFLIRAERIHVNIDIDLEFLFQNILQFIDSRMDFYDIGRIRHFHVDGSIGTTGAVVVDFQVMDADDIGAVQGTVGNFPYQFRGWCLAEENVDDFLCQAATGIENEQSDERTGSGIDGQSRKLLGNGGQQDTRRGDGVVDAVGCSH